ncbi:MarR family winged helix-turn-helix transcriptional regulator [Streptomyces violaceus]|jgi:DNA-binding MarR family transcriptional regulator|uniref:DNA-binding MarR family transcriptional regulator n=2 Tax=Streptomyces TaxID=1883 RepID=A0A7W5F2K7_9ACTN|nr:MULTISPECIES: MarR family transcriptional regulator [Streptomyces]MBB3077644.1 DNA-binding MarR family transcriptional regulator [Streptomyces violarus]WND19869.1 MarR family transcriptional regulator [Streptomyces janthinus]WNF63479.1 MarR family transcriptional regulator [Streptomyces sp. CGMCC 4.1456]WRU00165.1 MarR family transcriptional regulator [Streptomyces sp. CGMCC 4.1772]GGS93190.1 MarR family transcriptional regulator [Streptomyces janthinus]
MAERAQYEELVRQFSAFGAVKRELGRIMPAECPGGSAAVLTLLGRHGDMRMSKLAELLAVDMSVTSRHVAHVVDRGWIERSPDPADKRSRILRLTPAGDAQLDELSRRTTEVLEERLSDWSDEDVRRLTQLMARLRESFDCRPAPRAAPPAVEQTTRTPAST